MVSPWSAPCLVTVASWDEERISKHRKEQWKSRSSSMPLDLIVSVLTAVASILAGLGLDALMRPSVILILRRRRGLSQPSETVQRAT